MKKQLKLIKFLPILHIGDEGLFLETSKYTGKK